MPDCPKCGMQYLASHACPPVTLATNAAPLYVQVPDRYAEGYRAGRIAALREALRFVHHDSGALREIKRLLADAESGEDTGEVGE